MSSIAAAVAPAVSAVPKMAIIAPEAELIAAMQANLPLAYTGAAYMLRYIDGMQSHMKLESPHVA